jgi:hypothetical protein
MRRTYPEKGNCACGAVTFEIKKAPKWIAYCHCESCRRHTGAPVTTYVGMNREHVSWGGQERTRHESSPNVYRSFCNRCGTPLAYEADWCKDEVHLHISGFEHPERFAPTRHVLSNERLPWFDTHDSLKRFVAGSKQPASEGPG